MVPGRYIQYLDVSGLVAESTINQEYLTVAGVAVLPDHDEVIRQRAARLPKWREADGEQALEASQLIRELCLVGLALRVHKTPHEWERFWERAARRYSQEAVPEGAKRAGFLKAANVIRYWLFGECSARLEGECVRRLGPPSLVDASELHRVDLKVVCDEDIQGADNVEVFQSLWRYLGQERPLLRRYGLSERTTPVLATEQEEPNLILADHLAGAVQALSPGSSAPLPESLKDPELARDKLGYFRAPNIVIVDNAFDLDYVEIFGPGGCA